ncbi:putative AlkP superfamily pyrophosphatase or phosphodiesterase [Stella humosa]|uniref:Putative AlkP superfamily pyrophosphatase or phosphodiesterase n=1 Tax=Stella humosa TaxID=94 RepID=A0A3N1M283_9PROT|nr:alkaline phosphatase family protein [Stella humosa]ROQ01624.1 putative AlkP superfamily pyrophosphatase or phosphodiesterase [Stella humosa]BBK32005.1 alkaline phosphatase family protein [Stella humosa]
MAERRRVLLIVFDGLRPDMITPALMPHLDRFRDRSASFPLSRTVFPSETRVAVSSLVTGCPPGRHGLVANAFVSRTAGRVQTSRLDHLDRLAASRGGNLLDRLTLGERLAAAGRRMTVISTASPGATRLLNHRAAELGHVTLSAHGEGATQPAEAIEAATAKAGPIPPGGTPNTARMHWAADVLLDHVLPDLDPDLAVLWFSDPDSTWHYKGIGTPEGVASLNGVDAAFARVLAWADGEPPESQPLILIMSDHGHVTTRATVDMPALVRERFGEQDHQAGYSGGITLAGDDPQALAEVAEWLLAQPWCGQVFTRGGDGSVGLVPGSFDRRLVHCDHPDSPDIYYTLTTDDGLDAHGVDGGCLFHNAIPVGGSMHGGLHPRELANVLMVGGVGARSGYASPLPAGTIDVAPTILAHLGLPHEDGIEGRVLAEALAGGVETGTASVEEIHSGHRRLVRRLYAGRAYLDMAADLRPVDTGATDPA